MFHHGDKDRVVPVGNALLVIFRGAGHLVIIERAPEFNDVVRKFIKNVENGTFKPSREPLYR